MGAPKRHCRGTESPSDTGSRSSVALRIEGQIQKVGPEHWLLDQLKHELAEIRANGEVSCFGRRALEPFEYEAMRLLFWRAALLQLVSESLGRNETKKLLWLTTDVLHLQRDHQFAVAEAIYQRRWTHAKDPFAYISKVARTIYARQADFKFLGKELQFVGLDESVPDPAWPVGQNPRSLQDVEVLIDLHRALRTLKLPDEVVQIARAGYHGIAASKVAADFGWTIQKLSAARKGFDRAKEALREQLSSYLPDNRSHHWRHQPRTETGEFKRGK